MQILVRWLSPVFLLLSWFVFSFGAQAQTIDDFGFDPPLYYVYIEGGTGNGGTHPVALGGYGNIQMTPEGAMSRAKEQCEVVWTKMGYVTNWTEEETNPGWQWRGSCKRTDEDNKELFSTYVAKSGICSAEAPYSGNYEYLRAVTMANTGGGWIACAYLKSSRRQTGDQCPKCGNPIAIGTGNKFQAENDFAGGFSIPFRRYYNSQLSASPRGAWTHTYQRFLQISTIAPTKLNAYRENGDIISFENVGGQWRPLGDINDRLEPFNAGWRLTTADNTIELYDSAGKLQTIIARGGMVWTIENNGPRGHVSKITDAFGRFITIEYGSTVLTLGGVSFDKFFLDNTWVPLPITKIEDHNKKAVYYNYGTSGAVSSAAMYDFDVPLTDPPTPAKLIWSKGYLYNEATYTAQANPQASLTGIIDENGVRYASFYYDSLGRPVKTEHVGGVNSYSTTAGGDDKTVTDPLGTVRNYYFNYRNGRPLLRGMTEPCGTLQTCSQSMGYGYDTNANVTLKLDAKGNATCYAYDTVRNLETIRAEGIASNTCPTDLAAWIPAANTAERKILTTWHPTFRLPATITEPLGLNNTSGSKTTTHTYDANGNLTQRQVATPAGTRSATWTYDVLGRVLTATDARGNTSTNTYYPNTATQNITLANSRGMLASITNALGHTTTITAYNPYGQVLSMTDANGLTSTLTYDARQRLISRGIGSETTAYTYDGVGQLTSVTLPDNSTLTYTYDGAHRLVQIADGLGNKMVYTLDAMGNRIKEAAGDSAGALARTRSRVYDALNRLQQDIGGAGVPNTPSAQITQYAYDANGNQAAMTDPLARTTSQNYDPLNRLMQVVDPFNGSTAPTKYAYDTQDNLVNVTDPKGLATSYSYNGFNELISQTSPDTGTTSFTYDANANLLTKTDARNITATYNYDVLNRVTSIAYPATSAAAAETVTYAYDTCANGKGRLCTVNDKTGTTSYGYDLNGRITRKTQLVGGVTQTLAYTYNAAGQMSGQTLPSGKAVTYGYLNNRMVSINHDGNAIVKAADYEPFGPVGEWTWGNDSTTSPNKHIRYFDLDGRNTKIESGSAIEPSIIVYDAASRITDLQKLTNNLSDPAKSASYGYDNLDRLTSVTPGALGTSGNPANAQNYTYDAIGNRLSNTNSSGTTNYSYPAASHRLNALAGATTKSFSYDAVGNKLTDGVQTWAYGGNNRPVSVVVAGSNPVSVQSGINALGQRVTKTVNGTITRFVYDEAGRLVGEYDATGKALQETLWFNDLPVAVIK